jgi:hypothetical protein
VSDAESPSEVPVRRRTPSERLDWLTFQVGVLTARVGALERHLGIEDHTVDEPAPRVEP